MFQAVTELEVQEWVTAIQVSSVFLFYGFQYVLQITVETLLATTLVSDQL